MNIAILGFGTVGSGIYEILKNNAAEIEKSMGEEVKVKKGSFKELLTNKNFLFILLWRRL